MSKTFENLTAKEQQMLRAEVAALTDPDGTCPPDRLLAWAQQNPQSIAYQLFEWDEKKAADAFRGAQVQFYFDEFERVHGHRPRTNSELTDWLVTRPDLKRRIEPKSN